MSDSHSGKFLAAAVMGAIGTALLGIGAKDALNNYRAGSGPAEFIGFLTGAIVLGALTVIFAVQALVAHNEETKTLSTGDGPIPLKESEYSPT